MNLWNTSYSHSDYLNIWLLFYSVESNLNIGVSVYFTIEWKFQPYTYNPKKHPVNFAAAHLVCTDKQTRYIESYVVSHMNTLLYLFIYVQRVWVLIIRCITGLVRFFIGNVYTLFTILFAGQWIARENITSSFPIE